MIPQLSGRKASGSSIETGDTKENGGDVRAIVKENAPSPRRPVETSEQNPQVQLRPKRELIPPPRPAPPQTSPSKENEPVASKGTAEEQKPASQKDKAQERETEGTPAPFNWFFVPDESHNNRLNDFSLPGLIPSVFRFVFPQAQAEEICAPWQNPPLSRRFFKSNGRIRAKAFCKIYSHNPKECRELLEDLKKALERVQKVDNSLQRLEDRLSRLEQEQEDEEFERSISDDEETEAPGPLCRVFK